MTRLCNELEASGNVQSQRSAPDLGMLGSTLDINMIDLPSPMSSEPASPTSSISSLSPIRRSSPSPSPSRVKNGDMIRIALKIGTTNVPCIARCCPREQTSAVDEDFIRTWGVSPRPTPRMRLETRGTDSWCALDVVDVEKVGSTNVNLKMPIIKFQDPRFSVVLGVEALNLLGLIGNAGKSEIYPRPRPCLGRQQPVPSSWRLVKGVVTIIADIAGITETAVNSIHPVGSSNQDRSPFAQFTWWFDLGRRLWFQLGHVFHGIIR
ncbi:hypothetical protein CEP54_002392 [Fusarium duplospermum]|uniref:Uncharacterized protein n=1 Tax=Fusarium duplospermum TaxID=1325734 RepID=A0A428QVI9_9HYPO|nr:hypothetical protein CEP54_002392 [Fusarium duplospermum]